MTNTSAYNEKELKLDVGALSGDIYVASSRETFTLKEKELFGGELFSRKDDWPLYENTQRW